MQPPTTRHIDCNERARNLLPARLVWFLVRSHFGEGPRRNRGAQTTDRAIADKRREVRPGRRAEEGTGISSLQRGELWARSLQFCASLCRIIDPRTSWAALSHDRLKRAVAGRQQARQGSRCARPASPACGLDRLAAARLSDLQAIMASRERGRSRRDTSRDGGVARRGLRSFCGMPTGATLTPWLASRNRGDSARLYRLQRQTICATMRVDRSAAPGDQGRSIR